MRLTLKKYGEGDSLVLLHGLFGDGDNLRAVANILKDSWTVYCADLPNHGTSPRIDNMCFTQMSVLLKESLIEIDEKVVLIGHSLGGKVAMRYACDNPERVAHLIVLDIAPKKTDSRFNKIIGALNAIDLSTLESRKKADEELSQAIETVALRQFLLKSLWRDEKGWKWRFNLDVITRCAEQWTAAGIAGEDIFTGKVDFIRGGDSDYITNDDSVKISKHFPNARHHTLEHAGHWLHAEQPKKFIELLKSIL